MTVLKHNQGYLVKLHCDTCILTQVPMCWYLSIDRIHSYFCHELAEIMYILPIYVPPNAFLVDPAPKI